MWKALSVSFSLALGIVGFSLMVLGAVTIILRPDLQPPEIVVPEETCWSGTLAVQIPDTPEYWWVNYDGKTNNQVQICGVGLHVGDIMVFPDYSVLINETNQRLEAWRDCAIDGPPLCPEEYYTLKKQRH